VQAPVSWSPPEGVLGGILRDTRERIGALRPRASALRDGATWAPQAPALLPALAGACVAVIAEVKRRSPSRGDIRPALSAARQADAYARGGAAAISVLTEPGSFGGSAEDLVAAREAAALPILRKDFIVDSLQLAESRALGAAAVLLIARALPPGLLEDLLRESLELALEPLVEVRGEDELERALAAGARLIGVNNRNLETLDVDPSTVDRLVPAIPSGVVVVAESGVRGRADVERAAMAGADAVLVGSAISAADDPTTSVRALTAVARRARRG
jgi:indole-3-glycerol phosphate synthase